MAKVHKKESPPEWPTDELRGIVNACTHYETKLDNFAPNLIHLYQTGNEKALTSDF